MSRKLTELLGVNDGEIDFGYDGISHSIFIYDTALGGAGYSPLFREYKDEVLDKAYETLSKCDCERSCTKCLIDRKSQWYLNYLNRHKALEWLESERKSRIAPKSITKVVDDASAVTTDFATEIYQLTRNKNIKNIKFYIDNEYANWQLEDFPYKKLMEELILAGVDVSFVLSKAINIENISAPVITILMAVLFKHKVQYQKENFPVQVKPLLSVTFNDGVTKTYFGENIDVSLSSSWGNGDIYSTIKDLGLSYLDINLSDILQKLSDNDGSIMFDSRITEDCNLSNLCNKLIERNPVKWKQIAQNMKGKNVSLEYSDRYLSTPLGCTLLAHFINSLKQQLNINVKVINVTVMPLANNDIDFNGVNIENNYNNNTSRNQFLSEAISEIVGITPTINDSGYIEHERCMTIKSIDSELCIRPDAGIAHGWTLFGHTHVKYTDNDIRCNWDMDSHLYNKKKNYSGILYTISFNKL